VDARSVDAWVSLAAFPRRHLAVSKPPQNTPVNHYSTGSLADPQRLAALPGNGPETRTTFEGRTEDAW
jgi:hypothetical protein